MRDDITLRLPPHLVLKLDRAAAHFEMSRNAYISDNALEGGRPMIFTADSRIDLSSDKPLGCERSP